MEPNLSGVGGIHLGPLAETLVMRDVVPAIHGYDPSLRYRAAARSARPVPPSAARSGERDRPAEREPRASSSRNTSPTGPNEQSHLVSYYLAQRGIVLRHADPRELQARRRRGVLRDTRRRRRVPRLRDPRSARARAASRASRSTRSARCSGRTAWCRRSRATSTTRACFEMLTDDDLAARYVQRRGAAAVPPPRAVDANRRRSAHDRDARRPRRICSSTSAGTARSSC